VNDPVPDTTDLRGGAPLHDALLALLALVGVWRGAGNGAVESTGTTFRFGQQLIFAHDGRPFLAYEARAWLLDDAGVVVRQAWRESGFWRPGAGSDDVEVVLASNTGQALTYTGTAGDQQWEITTEQAHPTPTAKHVDAERRLYALLDDELLYATELAPAGQPLAPHLNARLGRVRHTARNG
jgi:hypothetical protein